MKFRLNILTLALAALHVADQGLKAGATATIGKPLEGAEVLPYGERARVAFEKIADWTPGQFVNAIDKTEAKLLRDPEGNTLMHRAIETGNIAIVELLHNDYGFVGNFPNAKGETAIDLAERAGDDFAAVFGDMKPETVGV